MQIIYDSLASFRSRILDPSLSHSSVFLIETFFTSRYSSKDDLTKENFFKVNHRSPSFSVTGEKEIFPFSLSHTKLDLSISSYIFHFIYSSRKNTFSITYNSYFHCSFLNCLNYFVICVIRNERFRNEHVCDKGTRR